MRDYVVIPPKELESKLNKIAEKINSLMTEGNFQEAEKLFQKQYELFTKYEKDLPNGKRHHKGATFYNWGYVILIQNNLNGYHKILLAYIEDLLDYDTLEAANRAPAYKILRSNPSISESLLDLVQDYVKNRIKNNRIPKDPEDILKPSSLQIAEEIEKSKVTPEQLKQLIDGWLQYRGSKEKRVFIGGNYRNIAVLRHISDIVRLCEFIPVIAVDLPKETKLNKQIYETSMEILKGCSYAIFEVTFSNGHLMEIEKTRNKGFQHIEVILVYQLVEHGDKPTVTKMLMTLKIKKIPYSNFRELEIAIRDFLPRT